MTSILVGGGWLDRRIDHAEIEAIKSAESIHDVSSIWGRIQDWFCGTRKEQAKQDLFILMSERSGQTEKMAAYCSLHNKVAEPYRRNFNCAICEDDEGRKFVAWIDCDGRRLEVEQSLPDKKFELIKVVKSLEENYFKQAGGQLDLDVHRQNCSFYGDDLDLRYEVGDGIGNDVKREAAKEFLKGCANDYQRKMLNILASQCGIIDLIGQETKRDKRFSVLGNEYFLNIEVNKLPGDNVRVDIVFENTIPANEKYDDLLASMRENERPYRNLQVVASFVIGKDKTDCLNADYSHVE